MSPFVAPQRIYAVLETLQINDIITAIKRFINTA